MRNRWITRRTLMRLSWKGEVFARLTPKPQSVLGCSFRGCKPRPPHRREHFVEKLPDPDSFAQVGIREMLLDPLICFPKRLTTIGYARRTRASRNSLEHWKCRPHVPRCGRDSAPRQTTWVFAE